MKSISLWLPAVPGEERALTSAELHELDDRDEVSLFVDGELTTTFRLPKGRGEAVLRDCGLVRQ